jgi:raffinose/stachyose/melibiose transport system substrate-binding protein
VSKRVIAGLLLASTFLGTSGLAYADSTLTIESWRSDDLPIWQDKILPVFMKAHPDIKVVFSPTDSTQYNAALNTKLQGGSAGDIITCRPFDASLALFKAGQLTDVSSLPGMENFSPTAKVAWSTDDGKTAFCVPMASVLHGFIYNKDAFAKVGITVRPRPWTSSMLTSTNSRPTAPTSRSISAPTTSGKRRPWATRTSGPIIGMAKTAARP